VKQKPNSFVAFFLYVKVTPKGLPSKIEEKSTRHASKGAQKCSEIALTASLGYHLH